MSETFHISYHAEGMLNGLIQGFMNIIGIPYWAIKEQGDMNTIIEWLRRSMNNSPFGYLYTVSEMFKNLGELETRWKEGDKTVVDEFLSYYHEFPGKEEFDKINKAIENNRKKIEKILGEEDESEEE